MSEIDLPLVRIESDKYGDTLLFCRNGYQSTGTFVNKKIAEECIKVLNKYLTQPKPTKGGE